MSDDSAVSRSVLAEQVKDRLLQDILAGRYPPHSRIVETRVARELGTSQAPVREALRGLEALGVVEILPFRGARVRRPTAPELLEAYVVRSELEALGARLGVPRMSDADLADLEALGEEMQAVADASFHARLLALAGNATLERVWRSLEPFSRTYITLVAPGADAHWTADLHPAILRALRTRDAEQVVAALRRHFDEAGAHLAGGWDDGQPASPPRPPVSSRRPH
jgi:DNA-binding GntR family transcriptional regulator